jgi:hypothetical protein
MGTFDYLPPMNDVNFILVVSDQLKVVIFQFASFQISYFNDPWNLPSPSASMEWVGHPGMAMSLSIIEVAYNIVQETSVNPDLDPPQELDLMLEPIWGLESLANHDPLELVFPSDEVTMGEITRLHRPWDDLHHKYYFLPEMRRIEIGEFTMTMNRDSTCFFNPLVTHKIYVEGNMESIAKTIHVSISRTLVIIENIFVRANCSSEEIQNTLNYLKSFATLLTFLMRRFQALTHVYLNMILRLTLVLIRFRISFVNSILLRK